RWESEPQRGQTAVGEVVTRLIVSLSGSRTAWTRRLPSGTTSKAGGSNTRLRRCGSRRVQMVRGYCFYDNASSGVRESPNTGELNRQGVLLLCLAGVGSQGSLTPPDGGRRRRPQGESRPTF